MDNRKNPQKEFDAFLSYKREDEKQVEEIAKWLEEKAGLKVWLDKSQILPGDLWQEKLEIALDSSVAYVILLGPGGFGDWQIEEMRAAISDRVSRKQIRIVPVLLPTARRPKHESNLPKFLRRYSWVKFLKNINEEESLQQLVWGIKGEKEAINADKNEFIEVCPFRGLEVFREQDAPFFYGRENIVQLLADYLETHNFLSIVGPSGSGKSSMVQAGLVPELKDRAERIKATGVTDQPILTTLFTPQTHPIDQLALAIRQAQKEVRDAESLIDIKRELESDSLALHYKALELCPDHKNQSLIVIIDQFEELFTQTREERDRVRFIQLLLNAVEAPGCAINIIVTMRSDFLGKCASYNDLNLYMIDNLFQVGLMEEEDMRRAIEEPARSVGLEFDDGLISRILGDTSGSSGELPLIEHALKELYDHRNRNRLTQSAYDDIGGVKGALANRAEGEFMKLSGEEQEILRKMFVLRLIQSGEGAEDTRRRATKGELLSVGNKEQVAENVIQKMTDARLLTSAIDETREQELVDVAHEALIRQWPRVQEWLKDERENTRVLANLQHAVIQWEREGRDADYLFSGTQLIKAEELSENYKNDLTQQEKEFINESVSLRDKSKRRRRLAFMSIASFVLIALVVVSILALNISEANDEVRTQLATNYWNTGRAEREKGNNVLFLHYAANALIESSNKELNKTIIGDINQEMGNGIDKILAQDDSIASASNSSDESQVRIVVFSTSSRWNAAKSRQIGPGFIHGDEVTGAVFSSDESQVLTWSDDDETAHLWEAVTGRQIGSGFPHDRDVLGAVFSSNESQLLTWSMDGTARLWETESGRQIGPGFVHEAWVNGAAFSLDESRVLTWSDDGTARLWETESGRQIGPGFVHEAWVNGAAFSLDESRVLTWSDDGTARLWETETGRQIGPGFVHEARVNGAAFSLDESRVLTWSDDGTARLWETETGRQIGPGFVHESYVNGAVFSSNESRVLTWSMDGTARLWESGTGRQIGPGFTHEDEVSGASLSSDDSLVLTWSVDKTARLWEAATGRQIGPGFTHDDEVTGASLSSDDSLVLTWSYDGTALLWEATTGRQIGPGLAHEDAILGAVFSSDDSRVLTWSEDGTAKVWDVLGDLDFPSDLFLLQIQALTENAYNIDTRSLSRIPSKELQKIRSEWHTVAQEHAKVCEYKSQNAYLQMYGEEGHNE